MVRKDTRKNELEKGVNEASPVADLTILCTHLQPSRLYERTVTSTFRKWKTAQSSYAMIMGIIRRNSQTFDILAAVLRD